jgi:hypothetical protein
MQMEQDEGLFLESELIQMMLNDLRGSQRKIDQKRISYRINYLNLSN